MATIEFGSVQIKIMRVLWEQKIATAQEITDKLSETEPTKLVNVQMTLKRLVEKGAVSYDVRDRTFIYYPLVDCSDAVRHAVHTFVDRVFDGSVDDLMLSIIDNEMDSQDG